MEGFQAVIGILSIIWGILSIILFFKVWEMTNDVKKILNLLIDVYSEDEEPKPKQDKGKAKKKLDYSDKSKTKKQNGDIQLNKDADKQDLMMAFNDECLALFKQCDSKEEFESGVNDIVTRYNKLGGMDYSTLKDGLWEQFKQL